MTAPESGASIASIGGALLFGKALIVGGGRFVAARVAKTVGDVKDLTVIERDQILVDDFSVTGVTLMVCPVQDANFEAGEFDSIFYDIFPYQGGGRDCLPTVLSWLRPGGRFICAPSVQLGVNFICGDAGMHVENTIRIDQDQQHEYDIVSWRVPE